MFDPDYDLFLQIVEAGSLSAAARSRRQSVAGLSKRLVRLEERLGVRLIHRTTRRLIPTKEGKDLLQALLPLRTALENAEALLAGQKAQIGGPLSITAPTSFGRMHVVPRMPNFLTKYPEIELSIDLSDDFVDLLDGRYDIAIRIGASIGTGLVGHRLGTSHRILCAAREYLETFGEPSTLSDLSRHRLIAANGQLPWQLTGPNGHVVHHGTSHIRTNSSEVVRELALRASGIALRSLWDVSDALTDGALQQVLGDYRGSEDVGIFAVHTPAATSVARVAAIVEHLKSSFESFA